MRSLHDRLAAIGSKLLAETSLRLVEAEKNAKPQSEDGVTYAAKLTPDDARLDWAKPARVLERQVRGLSPAPGAWFMSGNRKRPGAFQSAGGAAGPGIGAAR